MGSVVVGGDDLYDDAALRDEVLGNVAWFDGVLTANNMRRFVFSLDSPAPLTSYGFGGGSPGYLSQVRGKLADRYGGDLAEEVVDRNLLPFIEKHVLGVSSYGVESGFDVQVKAGWGAHILYAVEVWMHQPSEGGFQYPVNMTLYGFTDPADTLVVGGDVSGVSAAFTCGMGYRPMWCLYALLGRLPPIGRQHIERMVRGMRGYSLYKYERVDRYYSNPFTVPLDVVYYPQPREYGVESVREKNYLILSLRAKKMVKAYMESLVGGRFPVKSSVIVDGLGV